MKCVCGYEHESGFDDDGFYKENLKGDKRFIHLEDENKIYDGVGYYRIIFLYMCPKCGTIRGETNNWY